MSEKITYLSLILAIAGLVILTFASEYINPPRASIRDITQSDVGMHVIVKGIVEDVHVFKGGSAVLTLSSDNASMKVYLPYEISVKANSTLFLGEELEVSGVVSLYEGDLELVAEELR
ncbi:MAG: OB-fold nucleic acid binding domain-containing protein [Methanobacteriota archaeon]